MTALALLPSGQLGIHLLRPEVTLASSLSQEEKEPFSTVSDQFLAFLKFLQRTVRASGLTAALGSLSPLLCNCVMLFLKPSLCFFTLPCPSEDFTQEFSDASWTNSYFLT